MDRTEFLYAAVAKFGKRISLAPMNFPGQHFTINARTVSDVDQDQLAKDISSYPLQAWLLPEHDEGPMTCPECNAILSGFLSCFAWGIQHGIGYCGMCKKVEFRYYHYVGKDESRVCLCGWAIAGYHKGE